MTLVPQHESRAFREQVDPRDKVGGVAGHPRTCVEVGPVQAHLPQLIAVLAGRLDINAKTPCSCSFLSLGHDEQSVSLMSWSLTTTGHECRHSVRRILFGVSLKIVTRDGMAIATFRLPNPLPRQPRAN